MKIDEAVFRKIGEAVGKEVSIAIKQAEAHHIIKQVHDLTKELHKTLPNMTIEEYLQLLDELIKNPDKLRKVIELDSEL